MIWVLVALAVVVLWAFVSFYRRSSVEVPCTLDLERTHEHFHAHVELDGVFVNPGDGVQVFEAPTTLEYGEVKTMQSRAVVKKAGWLRRKWTQVVGALEFYELYDVGFE